MRPEAEWFWTQALHEMEDARALLAASRWAKCCFSCEQGAQTALKAVYLEQKGAPQPREHDLLRLGRQVGTPESLHAALAGLNPFYMGTRYPDVAGNVPALAFRQSHSRDAFAWAAEVLRWCAGKLGTDEPGLRLD